MKLFVTTCLAIAGLVGAASAQVADGEFWEVKLGAKTLLVAPAETPPGDGLDPSTLSVTKGKISKAIAYLRSDWNEGDGVYDLTAWTQAADESWVQQTEAGTLAPFGEGYPDSGNAALDLTLKLNPTPEEGAVNEAEVEISGLVSIKAKLDQTDAKPTDEVQAVDRGGATGGNFSLDFDGNTTNLLDSAVTTTAVQSALENLPNIEPGDVLVAAGGPDFTITFQGTLAATNVPQITVGADNTTGGTGVTTSTTVEGAAGTAVTLKSASFKLDKTGAVMGGTDFLEPDGDLYATPKVTGKVIDEADLPFSMPKM